jgi:N-acetylneuraminic acid mutarotase
MRLGLSLLVLLMPALAGASPGAWETGAALPLACGEVTAARVGSEIAVVGGFTADGQNSRRVESYSPARDTWRRLPDLPVSVDHGMSAGYRGTLYVAVNSANEALTVR